MKESRIRRRALTIAVGATAALSVATSPAYAAVNWGSKSAGVSGRATGTGWTYREDTVGSEGWYVKGQVTDFADGGSDCAETWVDLRRGDGVHHSPFVFKRCVDSGSGVSGLLYAAPLWSGNPLGMDVVVCDVSVTNYTRNSGNCWGDLSAIPVSTTYQGMSYTDMQNMNNANEPTVTAL